MVATDRRSVRSARLSYDDWQLAFDDEFTGEALDPAKWGYRQLGVLNPDSDRSKSESSADAVAVQDGTLRLTAKRNPAVPGQFLNGHISTESTYSFTYGAGRRPDQVPQAARHARLVLAAEPDLRVRPR